MGDSFHKILMILLILYKFRYGHVCSRYEVAESTKPRKRRKENYSELNFISFIWITIVSVVHICMQNNIKNVPRRRLFSFVPVVYHSLCKSKQFLHAFYIYYYFFVLLLWIEVCGCFYLWLYVNKAEENKIIRQRYIPSSNTSQRNFYCT